MRGWPPTRSENQHINAMRDARPEITRAEVSATLVKLLRRCGYSAEELLGAPAPTTIRKNARDAAEAALRRTLADLIEVDTPANAEAVGRATVTLLHLAMDDMVRDVIEREREIR